jgi:SNF2 family DNA or RNA helicase
LTRSYSGFDLDFLEGEVWISRPSLMASHDWKHLSHSLSLPSVGKFNESTIKLTLDRFYEGIAKFQSFASAKNFEIQISERLIDELENIKRAKSEFQKLTAKKVDVDASDIPNLGLKKTLKGFQKENILKLLKMSGGSNFSVPGSGKTLTTLGVWQYLSKELAMKLLVVCPISAFGAWESEIKESIDYPFKISFLEDLRELNDAEVLLINYEKLESDTKLRALIHWMEQNKTHLVVDEAHRIKGGQNSVRWRAARELALRAKRVDVLTGTPMPNSIADLRALYQISWPALTPSDLSDRVLVSLAKDSAFVRTTKDDLDIPPAEYSLVKQRPDDIQAQILLALKDRYAGIFNISARETQGLAKKGKAVMTLIAASTNPNLLATSFAEEFGYTWPPSEIKSDKRFMDLVREYARHEMPWKFKYLSFRAAELAEKGEKLIIWSNFVGTLFDLNRVLANHNPALIYGGVMPEERAVLLKEFKTSKHRNILITNPQTLAEGVSLHETCHNAIYVDRTFHAGLYLQSLDRIHRLGLTPDIHTKIQILETEGSIDEVVEMRLNAKINALSSFLRDDGLRTASISQVDEIAGESFLGLDDEDFNEIFKHLGT